jgi:LysR family nitrogen assimilation transcriptional regulator
VEDLGDVPLILTTRPNSLRLFVETRLARIGKKPKIGIEANTLPLMTDLVMARLGHTVLPSCGVRELVKKKLVSACPVEGFYITWLIAQPKSRPLSFAALQLARVLREIADEQIAKRVWERVEMVAKDAESGVTPDPRDTR